MFYNSRRRQSCDRLTSSVCQRRVRLLANEILVSLKKAARKFSTVLFLSLTLAPQLSVCLTFCLATLPVILVCPLLSY